MTRPSLFDYIAEPGELQTRADEMFGWIAAGDLDVRIGLELPLASAVEAHEAAGRTPDDRQGPAAPLRRKVTSPEKLLPLGR